MSYVYQHYSGLDEAVFRNITACRQLTQITRSSLGPNGRFGNCVVPEIIHTHPMEGHWKLLGEGGS